jgi:hypothetical protein
MKLRRRPLFAAAAVTALGLLLAAGWMLRARLDPEALRAEIAARLDEMLPAELVSVRLGPVTLGSRLRVGGLSVAARDAPSAAILEAEELNFDLDWGLSPALAAVEIRRPVLRIARDAGGGFPALRLLERLVAAKRSAPHAPARPLEPLPELHVLDGRIVFEDAALPGSPPRAFELRQLRMRLSPARASDAAPAVVAFDAELRGGDVEHLEASGVWQPAAGRLAIERLRLRLSVSPDAVAALPEWLQSHPAAAALRDSGAAAHLEGTGRVAFDGSGSWSGLEATLTLSRGGASLPFAGARLESIAAILHLSGETLAIESLRAQTPWGGASLAGQIRFARDAGGAWTVASTELRLDAPRAVIDDDSVQKLPPGIRKALDDNRIRGAVGVVAALSSESWPPRLEDWTVAVSALGLRFQLQRFAYPVDLLEGQLALAEGKLLIDPPIIGTAGSGKVLARGLLDFNGGESGPRPGRVRSGKIIVDVLGAQSDLALAAALEPKTREFWRLFEPIGKIDVHVESEWNPNAAGPAVTIAVEPRNGKFRFKHFPVTVDHLQGTLVFDLTRAQVLVALDGRHRFHPIRGEGAVSLNPEDFWVDLRLSSERFSLNQEILAAMPPEARAPLTENRVSGETRVEVAIHRPRGGHDVSTRVRVHAANLVLHPARFPSPIVTSDGWVEVSSGRIVFEGVESRGQPYFRIDGQVTLDGAVRRGRLTGEARNLAIDDRVLSIFESQSRRRLQVMHLRGLHDFRFDVEFEHRPDAQPALHYLYDISELRTRDVGVDIGIRLSGIALEGKFSGSGSWGGPQRFEGSAKVRSLTFNRLRFEDSTVTFAYGVEHPVLRDWREGRGTVIADRASREQFIAALDAQAVRTSLQIRVDPAGLYGGTVRGFTYVNLDEPGVLSGHFTCEKLDIQRAARGIHENERLQTSGAGNGEVRFSGRTGAPETLTGGGWIRIEGAHFADLPLFSRALEAVSASEGAGLGFNRLRTDFKIKDEKFEVDDGDLVLQGPSMNLRGQGTMDFYGMLDLSLVPELLDFKFNLVDLVKKNLAKIEVTGMLENPRARLVLLRVVPVPLK